ncbi:MAG: MATE family efflux transporter [Lachnospiraceae bacterium]|nr:MATE family efflux transporter [Lachnospiraceae bacterium]
MKKLTEGKPIKVILIYTVPLLIGQLFQLFYSIVDTRIVGQMLGEGALAAVGATTSLSDLFVFFVFGATNGFAIITASCFGAKDLPGVRKAIAGTICLGTGTAAALSAFCLIFINPILRFMKIDGDLVTDAKSYICIILGGLVISTMYNICAATMRAVGDSVTPLIFLIISAFLNIILDYSLIAFFNMGVAGAAVATVMSQLISAVLCIIYIIKKYPELIPKTENYRLERNMISKQIPAGLSMGFMNSLIGVGTLCLQTQINSFGSEIIVSHTASRKLFSLTTMPFFVLSTALSNFSAQNMGAGKIDRIKEGLRDTTIFSFGWSIFTFIVIFFFTGALTKQIIGMDSGVIIDTTKRYMRFASYFYPILAMVCLFRNTMQGFGDSRTPIISSLLELFVKILVAFILCPIVAYDGVILCEPIAWCIMVIPLIINLKRNAIFREKKYN